MSEQHFFVTGKCLYDVLDSNMNMKYCNGVAEVTTFHILGDFIVVVSGLKSVKSVSMISCMATSSGITVKSEHR